MNRHSGPPRLTSILAACDDLIAAGVSFDTSDLTDVPEELRSKVLSGLHCLQQLNQAMPVPTGMSATENSPNAITAKLTTDSVLGRFRIECQLGQGGFGTVYLALDPQLGRKVALKVPRFGLLLERTWRARFEQEARAAALLDHPNIVTVYESGTVGLICYIVSAYCPGCSLAQWITAQKGTPAPVGDIVKLLMALASAVHHAHSRGVLHRDLTPGNILLTLEQAQEGVDFLKLPLSTMTPKIIDFGLSKQPLEMATEHSVSGIIAGTPCYMSPEAANGRSREITTATDVYGLGTILYELLTGQALFEAASPLDALDKVRHEQPVDPRKARSEIPLDLAIICMKCLRKEPKERYGTAQELAEDLHRFTNRQPIRARRVSTHTKLWLWARRHPAVSSLLAVTLVLVLGVLGGAIYHVVTMEKAVVDLNHALAVTKMQSMRAETSRDACIDSIKRFLIEISETSLQHAPRTEPLRRSLLTVAVKNLEQLTAMEPENNKLRRLFAQALLRHAMILERMGDNSTALLEYANAMKKLEDLLIHSPEDQEARFDLGAAYFNYAVSLRTSPPKQPGGGYEEQEKKYFQSLELFDTLVRDYPSNPIYRRYVANIHEHLGLISLNQKSDAPAAIDHHLKAMEERKKLRAASPDNPEVSSEYAMSLINLGVVDSQGGDLDHHAGNYVLQMPLLNTGLGCSPLNLLAAQIRLDAFGRSLRAYLLFKEARQILAQTIAVMPGDNRYRRVSSQAALYTAKVLSGPLQRDEEAKTCYDEAIVVAQTLITDYPSVQQYRWDLAGIYHEAAIHANRIGKKQSAIDSLVKADALFDQSTLSLLPARVQDNANKVREMLKNLTKSK